MGLTNGPHDLPSMPGDLGSVELLACAGAMSLVRLFCDSPPDEEWIARIAEIRADVSEVELVKALTTMAYARFVYPEILDRAEQRAVALTRIEAMLDAFGPWVEQLAAEGIIRTPTTDR